MLMRNDPFSKLGALDQKLFTVHTTPQPASLPPITTSSIPAPPSGEGTREPGNQGCKEPRKQAILEGRKLPTKQVSNLGSESEESTLDLNQRPDRQNTYAFTTDKLERLEDLKILIRRRYDLNVTQDDLIRCAVHMLLDDYRDRSEGSIVLARLRKKTER
jgi:hypothetical protein